jgi:O-methyltransferase
MSIDLLKQPKNRIRYLINMVRYIKLFRKYKDSTMINARAYVENLALLSLALKALPAGAIVECGTWKGGMAAGMIEIGGSNRRYFFFDSFSGLPPARDIDGPEARRWQSDTASPRFNDNCSATVDEFEATLRKTNISHELYVVKKGFFEQTFPSFESPPIAVLRLDADWYDSTLICLEKFWDRVIPGGLILIDDYYMWDGCSRAVHDFLSRRSASERIRQGPLGRVAYILKELQD